MPTPQEERKKMVDELLAKIAPELMAELKKQVPGAAIRLGVSEDDLWFWLAGTQGATVTTWVDPSLSKAQEAEYMIEKASEMIEMFRDQKAF